jgi:pyruvate/2-oxoglutarate/acetoin dehydrogenase E1 component
MDVRIEGALYPTVSLSYDGFEEADATLVAYGGMAEIVVEAAERLLLEEEILCEVVLPSALNPLDLKPICASVGRSGRLVVCEEAAPVASFGSEVIARVSSEAFGSLRAAPLKVAAWNVPIPNTRTLEKAILPDVEDVVAGVRRVVSKSARPVRLVN